MGYTPPRRLERQDELNGFTSGVPSIDDWVRRFAYQNQVRHMSSVFITDDDEGNLAGLYTLSSHSVERASTSDLFTGGPREIPVVLIGKLAVSVNHQGRGLGYSLLQDAVVRAIEASKAVASAAILVHTQDDSVVPFYEKFGFQRLGDDQRSLVLPLEGLDIQLS